MRSGDADAVVRQIKALLSNYRLRENIDSAMDSVAEANREEGRKRALQAVEDLASVYEYLPDEIDDLSGTKHPSREALQFATRAVAAAELELDAFLTFVPADLSAPVLATVKGEFGVK